MILKEKIYIITNKTNLSGIESAGHTLCTVSCNHSQCNVFTSSCPFPVHLHSLCKHQKSEKCHVRMFLSMIYYKIVFPPEKFVEAFQCGIEVTYFHTQPIINGPSLLLQITCHHEVHFLQSLLFIFALPYFKV